MHLLETRPAVWKVSVHHRIVVLALSPRAHLVVYVKVINQPSLPTPIYSLLVSISVFMALSTAFHFINPPDNSPFSELCSSGLISALLVLSTIHLLTKVSLSPEIILGG